MRPSGRRSVNISHSTDLPTGAGELSRTDIDAGTDRHEPGCRLFNRAESDDCQAELPKTGLVSISDFHHGGGVRAGTGVASAERDSHPLARPRRQVAAHLSASPVAGIVRLAPARPSPC